MLKEFNENLNSIKKIQSEMKYSQIEIKNNLQGNNSRVDEAEYQINDLKNKEAKNKQPEKQEEKRIQKIKDNIRSIWDNLKHSNICIIGMPEGEEEEQEIKNLFAKIMKENFPNLVKEIDIQVQEAQRVPNKLDTEAHTKTHHN